MPHGRVRFPARKPGETVHGAGPLTVVVALVLGIGAGQVAAQMGTGMPGTTAAAPDEAELRVGGLRVEPGAVISDESIALGVGMDAGTVPSEPPEARAQDEWVIAPIPGYKPVFGATLLLGVANIHRPAGAEKSSSPWMSGGGVFVAENGSWGLGLGHKMNLGQDRWRITAAAAYAEIRYRFYGIGTDAGDRESFVPLKHEATAAMAKVMHQLGPGWFGGVKLVAADSRIRLDAAELPPGLELPPEWGDLSRPFAPLLVGLTPTLEYDSRDNEFFPRRGILFSAQAGVFSKSFGSDFDFQVYTVAYNHFLSVGSRGVVGVRAYARVAAGDVPFFAMSSLGKGSDIRGYTPGRYRDKALLSGQVEYRHEYSDSWCAVAFAGIGAVGPSISGIPRGLPAGGVGVRYRLARKNKVSLRMDAAWGRDDHAISLSVGEAF